MYGIFSLQANNNALYKNKLTTNKISHFGLI